MKFAKILFTFGMLGAVLALMNIEVSAKDEWRGIKSKNFQIIGSANDSDLRIVAGKLEQFRFVFTQLFPQMKFDSPIPTRVVVFKDDVSYQPFKTVEWSQGYFQPGEDLNYIVLTTDSKKKDDFSTIFHEYTHFLIDNSLGRTKIPPWFNEGVAEYYERFAIENGQKVTLGAVNENDLRILEKNRLNSLESLLTTDYYTLHHQTKESAQLFYAQSWALIHYLFQGNNGARSLQLNKYADLLVQGIKPKDAFEQAFQGDYAAMETELNKYLTRKKFDSTIVPFKEKLFFDQEMQSFSISDAEAAAFQGDLLYHTNRYDEAEKVLNEALKLDANSSVANTALGWVLMRRKKFVEARICLEKAIRADTQNYLAYYGYAFVLSREGMTEFGFVSGYNAADADKMRESLQKAINLNPNFAESYNLFAFVNIARNEDLDESIEMINKALKIAPGNQWYEVRFAELLMRKEDFTTARNMMRKILQTASDDSLKIYAENSIRTINSLEAQLEDVKNDKKREQREEVTDAPLSDEEIAKRRAKAMLESLNETLRKPKKDEKRLLGYVTNIDCQASQIIYSIKSDDRILQMKGETFDKLKLISFEFDLVDSEFGCGSMKKDKLSVITFRPNDDANSKVAGEIVSIEFVPKTFRFLEK